ncbi:MAG: hypothetical protein D3912_13220, partial [Candidatus Electrothrix sp. AX1]|nr:hypothetical protein [Candidatus Electrothrix sp. AX1]
MTGEQTPEAESPPAFGEILINPQAETAENKKEDPVSPAKANKQRIPQKRKPQSQPSKASKPSKPQRKKNKAKKAGSKKKLLCCLALILLLPAALFLSYLAAATYLLPYYIQEQLTAQYSQQLNRPVTVTQAQFAPFSFDLHLAGIHIGPERSRKNNNEPALCRIATIDTRLRPEALLDGKLIFENVQIKGMQAEITRRADGSFTDLGLSGKEGLGKTTQSLLPRWFSSWLQVDGLSLTESMLVLRDATSGHEYHLDEIAFSLPSVAKQQDAQTPALPTLHALVNGNPVQIRGERHIRQDNSSVTRLRLQLDDIDPQQLIDWLPNMGNLLRITTEKTTASLELILPDSPPAHLQGNEAKETKEEIRLSGKVSFTGLNITSLKTSSFQCKAPSAELVIQANPLRKQYQVEELTLNSPAFSFTENKSADSPFSSLPFGHWPGQLLTPASLPIDLSIHQLTIHQGTLLYREREEHEQPWENLQLELTGYRNQELLRGTQQKTTRAAALSFSAQQGSRKVAFQGTTTPALELIGEISLQNWNAGLFNPYVKSAGADQSVQLQDGTAQLIMQVNPLQKQYTVTELTLDKPLFKQVKTGTSSSSSSRPLPFSLPLNQLFNPVALPFDLVIDQLTMKQGILQLEQGQPWENLQLKLTDYCNRVVQTEKATTAKAFSFSARQGTRRLAFQGTTTPAFELIGKISLQNWNARFLNPYLKTAAGQGIQLQDGTAQLVMQVNPVQKQYTITELTLDKPKLKQLRAKKSSPSSTDQPSLALSLGQILNPTSLPFHLIIQQLTITQGTLQREQEQPWKNLQLKLTEYRNQVVKTKRATKAKAFSFSAQQGSRKVEFQGITTPAFDLIGKLSLQNWNARFLNPYLKTAAGQGIQLQDGTAHLVMQVNPVQKQYTITELTLDTPQIIVNNLNNSSSSDSFPFAVPLGELFNPVSLPFELVVDHLTINKGVIEKQQGTSWQGLQDLQLDLTAYRNGEKLSAKRKKKATALSFAEAAAL